MIADIIICLTIPRAAPLPGIGGMSLTDACMLHIASFLHDAEICYALLALFPAPLLMMTQKYLSVSSDITTDDVGS